MSVDLVCGSFWLRARCNEGLRVCRPAGREELPKQLLLGAGHAIAPRRHPSGGGLGSGRGIETGVSRLLTYWLDTYSRDKAYRVPTLTLSQANDGNVHCELRAVYYVRRSDDLKMEAAGSLYLTFLDAVTGFNHVVNTPRARRMLAVIARSGQFLPICVTF